MARPATTSASAFIAAALKFIDAEGVDGLSLRSLGQRMGLSHATIYRHFESKEALIEALIDDQLGEVLSEVDVTQEPVTRLKSIASALRRHFNDHPNLLRPFINGRGQGEHALKLTLQTIAGLRQMGISGPRLSHWMRILENYVIGGLVYDYAAAPDHLAIRAQRLNALSNLGELDQVFTEEMVAAQNLQAFEDTLSILLDLARKEGANAAKG